MPFVFDNLDRRGVDMLLGGLDEGSRALAGRTAQAWVTAARTGLPAHDDLDWPAYDLDRRLTCVLDRNVAVEADPGAGRRTLWDELSQAQAVAPVVD